MKRKPASGLQELLAGLSPGEQLAVLEHLQKEQMRAEPLSSPAAFALAHGDGLWDLYPHLGIISDELVAGIERDAWDLLIVTTPPRHGKSELISRWLPAWFIVKHRLKVGLATYEADFSASHGRATRDILNKVADVYDVKVRADTRSASRWELADEPKAGMWTAGVGGPITGKGGQLLIVDDPVKNSEEADSPVIREKVWNWWTSTFLTRKEPGGKIIVIMTRWHEDDLVGRLLKQVSKAGMRVKTINMPAIAEDDDYMGRKPGEALCPPRYDLAALATIRESVGSRVWSALFQQRPQRDGGSVFQRRHFRYWRKEGDVYVLGEGQDRHLVHESDLRIFVTFDPAFTRGKRSDYTALGVWGATPHQPAHMLLLEGHRVRVDSTEHAPLVEQVWRRWKPVWIGIEKTTASLTLLTEAQRRGVVVRPLTPDKSKGARAETAAAIYEAERVWHPSDATEWLGPWEDELLSFPVAAHDDVVDVTSYAAIELARGTVRGRKHVEEDSSPIDRHLHQYLDRRHRRHRRNSHLNIGAM